MARTLIDLLYKDISATEQILFENYFATIMHNCTTYVHATLTDTAKKH